MACAPVPCTTVAVGRTTLGACGRFPRRWPRCSCTEPTTVSAPPFP